jgi:hypothetical protein
LSLVELARFGSRVEADAIMLDTEVNSFFGGGGLVPVRVMVLDEDHAEALTILKEDGRSAPG